MNEKFKRLLEATRESVDHLGQMASGEAEQHECAEGIASMTLMMLDKIETLSLKGECNGNT